MTEIEQLRQQVAAQTCDILRLRAEKAEALARLANMTRMHDTAQNHIGKLQAIIDRGKSSEAERVFGK